MRDESGKITGSLRAATRSRQIAHMIDSRALEHDHTVRPLSSATSVASRGLSAIRECTRTCDLFSAATLPGASRRSFWTTRTAWTAASRRSQSTYGVMVRTTTVELNPEHDDGDELNAADLDVDKVHFSIMHGGYHDVMIHVTA